MMDQVMRQAADQSAPRGEAPQKACREVGSITTPPCKQANSKCKYNLPLEATAWSALIATSGTLALVIGEGKKTACLLAILLYLLGSGVINSSYQLHNSRFNGHNLLCNHFNNRRTRPRTPSPTTRPTGLSSTLGWIILEPWGRNHPTGPEDFNLMTRVT